MALQHLKFLPNKNYSKALKNYIKVKRIFLLFLYILILLKDIYLEVYMK